jgi:hypothetical protein
MLVYVPAGNNYFDVPRMIFPNNVLTPINCYSTRLVSSVKICV